MALAVLFTFSANLTPALATTATPTFSKDVAPILFKHCVGCHRPGQIASNTILWSYEAARPWAKAIKQKVLTREMPPWPADPAGSVKFANDARLSQEEIDTLVAWVNSGAIKGAEADLPALPSFPDGWLHPKHLAPDAVISMAAEFEVPATGAIPYVRYMAKVPFLEDKWIAALEVRPGNRAVVHHMAITEVTLQEGMNPTDLTAMSVLAKQMGMANSLPGFRPAITAPGDPTLVDMLGVYTPGTSLEMYPDDCAKLIKGGKHSYVNFNIHYQAIGKPAKDRSMLALWFRNGPPKHQLLRVPGATKTIIANGEELLSDAPGKKAEGTGAPIPPIPPFVDNYELTGITAYTEPITIFQFQPHAHVRCKDFKYVVVYPDDREQTILTVPRYDFQWQLGYDLETPLRLPAGSKLVITAHYDNSRNNPYNPAPDREVYFRDSENQSWDEMFTPFIQYSNDNQDLRGKIDTAQQQRGQNVVNIVAVAGCLERNGKEWILTHATEPIVTDTQSASTVSLKTAAAGRPGLEMFRLTGLRFFHPSIYASNKVAVKGALFKANGSINVTSLKTVAAACAN